MDIANYRTQIDAALAEGGNMYNFDDIVAGVAANEMQFWPGASSVIVTQIVDFPRKKVLHVFLAGGVLAEIEIMAPLIADWGRARGCTSIMLSGRKGWQRTFLTHTGWKVLHELVVMETVA